MRHCLRFSLLFLIFVCVAAAAQDTGKIVCGDPILLQTMFRVAVNPDKPNETYRALQEALDARAGQWTMEVRDKVTGAYSALLTEDLRPAAFKVDDLAGQGFVPKQVALPNTTFQFELPKPADDALCKNAAEKNARKEAAEFVSLVAGALGKFSAAEMKKAAVQIAELEKQYDKYLFDGFPMFPWEAAVNSWFLTDKSIANGPPRNAIVFAHPAAGVVSSIDSNTTSDMGGVLSIEPLGWIRYSDDYETWYGASLLVIFVTDREVGYGAAINYRNFKFGLTFHDDDTGTYDGAAIFLGMDLYQFLGEKQRSYKAYFEEIKKLKKLPP